MENPCFTLLEDLERGLLEIDKRNHSSIKKCSEKVELTQALSRKLRSLYFENKPKNLEREIRFFKEVKPKFFSELYFQIEVFNYYKGRPKGSLKAKKHHINFCLDKASSFITNHCEFHNYVKLGSTHLDELYFTNRDFDPKLHGGMEYPSDPVFSSPADPTLSCLMAADRYLQFLKNELFTLKNPTLDPSWEFMKTLDWNGSKTELVELIYAVHASGALSGELKDAIRMLEKAFNVDLGNFYRTYTDIKYKKNPTSFLDKLKTSLSEKIKTET